MSPLRPLLIGLPLLGLFGCGAYDPPVQGDRSSSQFKTDLEACRTTSHHAVYLHNAGTLYRWVISPITSPGMVRTAIRHCMEAKGYASTASTG